MFFAKKMLDLPTADTALPGRANPIPTASTHFVNGHPLKGPYPEGLELAQHYVAPVCSPTRAAFASRAMCAR